MKKRIIIVLLLIVLLLIIVGFVLWNNRVVTTITLDINPSIKINLNKKGLVKSVIAINEDAKSIISDDLKGKDLDATLDVIVTNVIENGYIEDDYNVVILMHKTGRIKTEIIEEKIREVFNEREVNAEIIIIKNITKEDEKVAQENDITPAKAAYINAITKDNINVSTKELSTKAIKELKEIKQTGHYCDEGAILEGDFCLKEIDRKSAKESLVCPRNYTEIDGVCYEERRIIETDKLECFGDYVLEDGKCVRSIVEDAIPEYSCDKGELARKGDVSPIGAKDNDVMYCVDKSNAKAPTLRCLLNPGHIMVNGTCYNGPAPTINGGCPNNDLLRNGMCYTKDDGDQYQCPNGSIYEKSKDTFVELCPDTFTYIKPNIVGYKCNKDYELNDKKCIKKETQAAFHERTCENGYKLVNNEKCINYNKTAKKENGYICVEPNSRIKGKTCVIYEINDAKHS